MYDNSEFVILIFNDVSSKNPRIHDMSLKFSKKEEKKIQWSNYNNKKKKASWKGYLTRYFNFYENSSHT